MQNKFKNLEELEAFLSSVPQFTGSETHFKHGVQRAGIMLDYFSHPERDLKIIHVAGSNGKGSVCALLDSALRSAGFKTALFSSPHLKSIKERIRISGELISDKELVEIMNEVCEGESCVREKSTDFRLAYFEYFFVAALLFFKRSAVDVVIMETGLGGRLDATNACKTTMLSVITPVSLEHTSVLGESIEEIALEKAGIIKKNVPVVVTDEEKKALEVFIKGAAEAGADIIVFEKASIKVNAISDENIDFSLHNRYYRNVAVTLPVPATYIAFNAGLALTALAALAEYELINGFNSQRLKSALPAILKGFRGFSWQGRMERIAKGIYVDGAHNAAGIEAFTESVAAFAKDKVNVLLFAVSDDKDKESMVRTLCMGGLFQTVIVTAFAGARSAEVSVVAKLFSDCGKSDVITAKTVDDAFAKAKALPHDYIFCTGSLYLAGEISI